MQWKKYFFGFLFFFILVLIFFWTVIVKGTIPAPVDGLVGMYHPWRDYYAASYPRGVPFKNSLIADPFEQQIPWRKQVITAEKQWKLPSWDATSFLGTPIKANIQAGAFYPFNIVFFFLPFEKAWTILIMLEPLLCGFFLFLYLQNLGISFLPAIYGGAIFAFSGFSIAWLTWGTIVHVMAWIPLSLLCIDKIFQTKKSIIFGILLVFSLLFGFFAGHSQLSFYSWLLIGFYVFYNIILRKNDKKSIRKEIVVFVGSVIFFICLARIQWQPMIQFLKESARFQTVGSVDTPGFFIPWQHLAQFFAPDYFGNPATGNYWGVWNYGEFVGYIGVSGIILALAGLSLIKSGVFSFWIFILFASIIFAFPWGISFLPYTLKIPVISSFQPSRLIAFIVLSLSVLSTGVLDALLKKKNIKALLVSVSVVGFIIFCLWTSMFVLFKLTPEHINIVKRNLMIPSIIFLLFFISTGLFFMMRDKKQSGVVFICGVLLLSLVDLMRFGWKFTPFVASAYFFPETKIITFLKSQSKPFRVMTVDRRIIHPNINTFYDIESVSGYDPLYNARYERFMAALERGKPDITPPYGFNRIIVPTNITSPLFRLLNTKYVLSFENIFSDQFVLAMEEGETKLFEYKNFLPRVYLVERVKYRETEQNVIDALYEKEFDPGRSTIIEEPIEIESANFFPDETATITSYSSERIDVTTKTQIKRFLYIGNRFDTGWSVYVDGKKVSPYRANYLFFGIVVPEGNHQVKIQYE